MQKSIFKNTLFILAFLFVYSANAQPTLFVRIYDLKGTKIYKGNVGIITDSSIQLNKSTTIILVKNIGMIKTKRSFGHNVLLSSGIAAGFFATVLAIGSTDKSGFFSYTAIDGVAVGLTAGAILGAIFSPATAVFKNSISFPINGSQKNWKELQHYYAGLK